MKRSLSFIGSGLLVVALGSVGCSSKSSNATPDSGTASGTGGSSAGGTGGTKSGTGGAGGAKADAGGTVTVAACTTATVAKGPTMTCAMCACTKNIAQAVACETDAQCWNLIACASSMCAPGDTTCITGKCASSLAGATPATALGMTLTSMCKVECPAGMSGTDAGSGHDAGN